MGIGAKRDADRASLLPQGLAILQFGIEEAVLDICFALPADEASFIEKLERSAAAREHQIVQCGRPFLSHWVVADSSNLGPGWDEF